MAIFGFGALFLLLLLSSSGPREPLPPSPPSPPPPPPPVPPSKPVDHDAFAFFNYATGEAVDPASFLNWGPGQTPSTPPTPKPPTPPLPRVGERWQATWTVNRELSFFEMSAAKAAFSSLMTDQRLDDAHQYGGTPNTIVLTSTFTVDAVAPIPVGKVIEKSGVVATLTSAKRVG